MQRLDARPFECRVQVRIPVRPELDRREERLDDRLLLVIAAGAANRHEGLAITQDDAGRERIARARPRPQLAARLLSSQNCSPRTLMPMPVLPRMTAPPIQPPLGVESKTFPSLSMMEMWVVSLSAPAIGSGSTTGSPGLPARARFATQ